MRKDEIAAALQGHRQWFAADFDHPTRGPLTIQAEYVPQIAPDGSVAGLILVIQDITEQRAAEIALRESEARFRRIADSAPTPVWVTRLDRTRDFVNDAYMEFLGLDREAARKVRLARIIHPEDHDRIVAEIDRRGGERGAVRAGRALSHGKGEYRWLRACRSRGATPTGG